jgi:hypothetical protein
MKILQITAYNLTLKEGISFNRSLRVVGKCADLADSDANSADAVKVRRP